MYKTPAEGEDAAAYDRRALYNKKNAFFKSQSFDEMIYELPESERKVFRDRKQKLAAIYAELSDIYQSSKGNAGIPLA